LRPIRCLAILACLLVAPATVLGADLTPVPAPEPAPLAAPPSGWSFRFVPYGWLVGLTGNLTLKGRTASVNLPFDRIVDETLGKGGTLIGFMGDFEVRYGAFALYGDLVWANLGLSGNAVHVRGLTPRITGTLGTSHSFSNDFAIVEGGAAYEVARFTMPHGDSPGIPVAIDLVAGARYWYINASLSLNAAASLDLAGLDVISSNLAIAKSGTVDWVDPIVGARARFMIAPGQEIFLRGDVGGFGVGSRFTWQAVGGYSFDFAEKNGITYSGLIGYRALYVDYVQGTGRNRFGIDTLTYGPVVGLGIRF
jgi:hypothetical protein